MALQQAVCVASVMTILLCTGCNSQLSECGRANLNTKIVGGQDASVGSWPWQAYFEIGQYLCGGSLINNQWVLTAAHCITINDLNHSTVTLGLHNTSGPNTHAVKRTLDDVICHPQYNSATFDNDICLVKLSDAVNFTDYITPICLADANSTFYTGLSSWVTGFGKTGSEPFPDTLQEVNVPIVGNNECKCYNISPPITDNMLCAGLKAGGKDSCQGDSGGPLVTTKGSIWVQSGVVSYGNGCGLPKKPGVYARVSKYQDWITDTVDGPQPGFVTFLSEGVDSDWSFTCPTPTPDYSVYGGGEHLFQFAHASALCVAALCVAWGWN